MAAYISEASYAGTPSTDFVEVAVPTGTDVSGWTIMVYGGLGDYLYEMTFPAPSATQYGVDVYVFENQLVENSSVAIVDDTGTVHQFLSFYDPPATSTDGPLAGQTPTYSGATSSSGQSIQSDDGGSTYYTQSSQNAGTVPCFAAGMGVLCPDGIRPVESLGPGDFVVTRDCGPMPIRWVSRNDTTLSCPRFSDRPILLRQGVFGAAQDLVVSPQHRLLLGAPDQGPTFGNQEVLAPAKALTGLPGVRLMRGRSRIVWYHFALDSHQVVRVNNVWTESLLVGPMVLAPLSGPETRAIRRLFPQVQAQGDGPVNGPAARPCLSVAETHRLLTRHTDRLRLAGWHRPEAELRPTP